MKSSLSSVPEKVLEKTLQDLEIRAQVEATMESMLVDIEITASLQSQVETDAQVSHLESQVSQYETAFDEMRALNSVQQQETSSLADALVEQLWTLSQELGQLRRWKETHETTVTQQDELIAKLLQAEEQIRVLETRPAMQQEGEFSFAKDSFAAFETNNATVAMIPEQSTVKDSPVMPETVSGKQTVVVSDSGAATQSQVNVRNREDEDATKNADESIEKEVDALLALDDDGPSSAALVDDQAVVSDPKEADVAAAAPVKTDVAVVALLEDDDDDAPPTLDTLDMVVLTEIFQFLDAVEILNTAQINITMFSRVDALFGLSAEGEQQQEAAAAAPEAQQGPPTVVSTTTAAQPPNPPNLGNRAPLASPTTSVDAKMPAQPSNNAPPRRGGIFSLLQARGNNPAARRGGASNNAATTDQPLTAALTDSMVSKLNDKELSAIFSLAEKLHQRENAVAALKAEKEQLAGKLEGTEALKEFLINKVRDVEQSLHKSQEDEMKVAQQISSDQEVIAFLDGRVQELERDIKSLSDEKKTIAENMNTLQEQNDKKIEVLGDMLQFERERVSENEREWKATKKLLVKEIKSCRAQLLALQAERDGFREQNERLKKAVLLTNPSGGAM